MKEKVYMYVTNNRLGQTGYIRSVTKGTFIVTMDKKLAKGYSTKTAFDKDYKFLSQKFNQQGYVFSLV
jgi:hypothetical protein